VLVRVVVIGAGIVGAAVAAGLTRRGAQVTVLEERFPGAGTTGASFAHIAADRTKSESYFTLAHAAVHAHHALGGMAPLPAGHLEWASGEPHLSELRARIAWLRARDYTVERITATRAAELEPGLAPGPVGAEYVLFPEEAHVFPARLLGRFLAEARANGAEVETGAAVQEVGPSVLLAGGGVRTADVVIVCTGRWTGALLGVPLRGPRGTSGFLATTAPLPTPLSRILTTDRLCVRPDGGGRLLLRAPDLDPAADPAVPPPPSVAAELLARLPEVLTGTEGAYPEHVRVGRRAAPIAGPLVAGFVADRVYTVVTDHGITLAPLLADLVAAEVYGRESALLGPFRPEIAARVPAG
jgi:glycine/D-amino acid oxidase-like deaminating enzyme